MGSTLVAGRTINQHQFTELDKGKPIKKTLKFLLTGTDRGCTLVSQNQIQSQYSIYRGTVICFADHRFLVALYSLAN